MPPVRVAMKKTGGYSPCFSTHGLALWLGTLVHRHFFTRDVTVTPQGDDLLQ